MTAAPSTPDALREALARSAIEAKFGPEGVAVLFDIPAEATEHQRAVITARANEARRVADFALAGPLAPILATLAASEAARQTAERERDDFDKAMRVFAEAYIGVHETALAEEARAVLAEAKATRLEAALIGMTERYCDLVNSGDAGFWNPEEEPEVIAARAALVTISPTTTDGGEHVD